MKKYLFPALALGLVMTSCQSDEPFAPGEGGEKQVTFTLNVPGELGTRADFGQNKSDKGGLSNNAGELSYTLVLNADGDQRTFTQKGAGSVVFNPTVVLGRNYTVTAYAHFGNAWDGETAIDITKHFNDETKDAYFKQENIKFELNETSKQITLKRPFGKLRLLATDYTATGNELNTAVESVIIEYLDINASKFNPITGLFDDNGVYTNLTTPQTFGYYAAEEDGAIPIFADYIPANSEDNMVDFKVTVKYLNSNETYSRTFNDIPVRRNALTTLKGNFFTAGAEITVNVEDNFDNFIPGEGNAEEQLRMAIAMGGSYTLQSDVTLSEPLQVGANMVLDLNGKTITGTMHKSVGAVIKVAEGASLKVIGGTISSTAENGGSAIENKGTLKIEGTTLNGAPNANGSWPAYTVNNTGEMNANGVIITSYHGAVASYGDGAVVTLNDCEIDMTGIPGFTSHGIYTYNNGKVVVNGGTYANKATDQNASGASVINGAVEVNAGTFTGRIENYYGTPVLKGGTYTVKPNANFIAAGYNVIETEVDGVKYYSVVEEGAVIENPIVSASQLQALGGTKVSGTYNLLADIDMAGYDMKPISLASGSDNSLIFNGNGHTIKNLNLVQDYQNGMNVSGLFNILHSGKEITVNDLKFVNSKSQSGKYSAVVLAYNSTTAVINLNNVDVDGATISAETVSPLVGYTTGPINLKDCDVANISMTGEKPEKIGAYVGTANQATCNVIVSNCTNNTEYKEAGRVINGATMAIDGKQYVADSDGLKNALNAGVTNIVLAKGEFEMPTSFIANNVTISGIDKENSILKLSSQLRADNKSLTLKDLTTKVPTGLNYTEHSFAWIHYLKNFSMINCNSDGRIRLNSHSATIEDCRFDVTTSSGFDGYAIFYYGPTASNVKVSNSVFNTVGKAIVLYNEGKPVLNLDVTNCQFKSSASTDKAAIQMHTEYGVSGTVDIVNSTATGFANINGGLWNEVNNNTKESTDNFEITVGGVKVH